MQGEPGDLARPSLENKAKQTKPKLIDASLGSNIRKIPSHTVKQKKASWGRGWHDPICIFFQKEHKHFDGAETPSLSRAVQLGVQGWREVCVHRCTRLCGLIRYALLSHGTTSVAQQQSCKKRQHLAGGRNPKQGAADTAVLHTQETKHNFRCASGLGDKPRQPQALHETHCRVYGGSRLWGS